MKRGILFWQWMVLFLVFLMAVGIYSMLAVVLLRQRGDRQAAASALPTPPAEAVQILTPLDGALVQHGTVIPVRVLMAEAGFLQAGLQVDGVTVGVHINPDPQTVPAMVEWALENVGEGPHRLAVQARKADGGVTTSSPLTVTVVPSGRLAFASNRDGPYAIYTMGTDGRSLLRLSSGPGDARQPACRQDGAVAFVVEGSGGGATIRQVTGNGEQNLFAGRDPAWSPDGGRLAYAASVDGVSQLFVAGIGQGNPVQVTTEEVYAGQPAWSPDGTRLAYVAEREKNLDIWVVSLDGREAPVRLTDDPAMDWAPAWSPDGSRLAFVSNRGGSHQIYVMRADGSEVHPVTDFLQGAEAPAWSPDGYWLAFVAYSGEGSGVNSRELYLMRAGGQDPVRLTHNSHDDADPDWIGEP